MPLTFDGQAEASVTESGAALNEDRTLVDPSHRTAARGYPPAGRGLLAPGTSAGDYELAEEVGRGAFGTVYRAVHPVIGKEVAIKVLDRTGSRDEQLEQRFVTEARAVNRIKHPNIVDIFGFGQLENGQTFYVMELLVGETLATLLKRSGVLAPEVALEFLKSLANALDAAHKVGVLHRDLKPANVFLHRDPAGGVKLKLLDFGVAKILGPNDAEATASGFAPGTPAYMAPEQWAAASTAVASDIYALGVIGYELLTGQRPFRASGTPALIRAHLFENPELASNLNPTLPKAVDAPLAAMLAKRPDERPPTAGAAVRALKAALAGGQPGTDEAQTSSASETSTVTVGASPVGWRVWALLATVAISVAALLAWRSRTTTRRVDALEVPSAAPVERGRTSAGPQTPQLGPELTPPAKVPVAITLGERISPSAQAAPAQSAPRRRGSSTPPARKPRPSSELEF